MARFAEASTAHIRTDLEAQTTSKLLPPKGQAQRRAPAARQSRHTEETLEQEDARLAAAYARLGMCGKLSLWGFQTACFLLLFSLYFLWKTGGHVWLLGPHAWRDLSWVWEHIESTNRWGLVLYGLTRGTLFYLISWALTMGCFSAYTQLGSG